MHVLETNLVPHEHAFLRATSLDRERFDHQDLPLAGRITAPVCLEGQPRPVAGLVMEAPRAHLFKVWARKAGFPLLVVRWAQPYQPHHRIVISFAPAFPNALKGLGRALEEREREKRERLDQRREGPPRYPDVDNNDPWYDGRSPAHAYTIVDSPRQGTVLDLAEVVQVLREGKWVEKETREEQA